MFRKPTVLKQNVARSYQQNFPPLVIPKKTHSYSAATKAEPKCIMPKCTMNFSAAAASMPDPPVHLPDRSKTEEIETFDTFDYNKGMLRAAHIIYERQLKYFADHGITPLPIEWNYDDFEPDEEYSSSSTSYCDDTDDDSID